MTANLKKMILIISGILVALFILLTIIFIATGGMSKNQADISNINSLPINLSKKDEENIKKAVFNYLSSNYSEYNDISSENIVIREKSYSETIDNDITHSTFIIDIESKKQSFRVNYNWSKTNSKSVNNPVTVQCLDSIDLIYGKFDCLDQSNSKDDKVDPILSYLPYSTDYYTITPVRNSDGSLTLKIQSTGLSRALTEDDYKQMVSEWLSRKGVNPNDYSLFISTSVTN